VYEFWALFKSFCCGKLVFDSLKVFLRLHCLEYGMESSYKS
jgi:hypothetical protein